MGEDGDPTTEVGMFIGIDVAKAELVVGVRPAGAGWTAANDATGVCGLVDRLRALNPTLIVLEATGGTNCCASRHSRPPICPWWW